MNFGLGLLMVFAVIASTTKAIQLLLQEDFSTGAVTLYLLNMLVILVLYNNGKNRKEKSTVPEQEVPIK